MKTTIQGEGSVVFHDQTPYGLRRLCVASYSKYPDLEIWLGVLGESAQALAHRYVEKFELDVVFIGYLWIYYKPGR